MDRAIFGTLVLILASILWGSSFIFIKLSVENISGFSYTFYRSLIALAALTPLVLAKLVKNSLDIRSIRWGAVTGVTYVLGLLLQGIGTAYTTPSISAFITGLNTVHVHIYTGLVERRYSKLLLLSLALSILGLYLVTKPAGGFGFGEFMVFLGSIAWAAEIILISRYSTRGVKRLEFLYGVLLPAITLAPYVLFIEKEISLTIETLEYLTYLALVCTLAATALQVIGQRYVSEATAAVIYLLEPVFAAVFSATIYGEKIETLGALGGALIALASAVAIFDEVRREKTRNV
ncbi:MAG: DMT family transporter [Ignisphaera sp.]|nr:DMT family transporter [Ignisphaera sp.]